ncbi:LytR/AlgR family response regulator transcription factor [Vagococcus sp.]|uniref:LytR/AlgR family response regulator transcription factor n=1 Tax=Vagococcus sp. TaxID=1933889 RepID=UPI003F994311
MNIAIVEDNLEERERLKRCFERYQKEQNVAIHLSLFTDGLEIVDQYSGQFDVIYFDVEMPIMDGMTAAKKIRDVDSDVLIVFITNYVQWAIEGYSVHATDFLLKPITYFNFFEHFKKIVPKLTSTPSNTLTLKVNNGLRKIRLDDLVYVESEGHYLHFHTLQNSFTLLDSMKNMEKRLQEHHFFRCNNCYLVNLKYVKAIDKNIVFIDKYELVISRPRKKEFLQALTNYLGNEVL